MFLASFLELPPDTTANTLITAVIMSSEKYCIHTNLNGISFFKEVQFICRDGSKKIRKEKASESVISSRIHNTRLYGCQEFFSKIPQKNRRGGGGGVSSL